MHFCKRQVRFSFIEFTKIIALAKGKNKYFTQYKGGNYYGAQYGNP